MSAPWFEQYLVQSRLKNNTRCSSGTEIYVVGLGLVNPVSVCEKLLKALMDPNNYAGVRVGIKR